MQDFPTPWVERCVRQVRADEYIWGNASVETRQKGPDKFATPAFLVPPPPIPSGEIVSEEMADVVVVGAGISGLMAAYAAHKAGVSVLVLEKAPTFSGRGGDITALNSRLHRKVGIAIDPDEVLRDYMKVQGARLHQWIYRLWAKNSGRVMDTALDLTEQLGMEGYLVIPTRDEPVIVDKWPPSGAPEGWVPEMEYTREYPTCHRLGGPDANVRAWLGEVEEHLRREGVRIMYDTQVVRIPREGQGKVDSVIAKTKDGRHVRVTAARGIVLATGDYSANREMVDYYFPNQDIQLGLIPTSTGEGHRMAIWIGAQMERVPHAPLMDLTHAMGTCAFLFVNRHGRRFCDEDLDSEAMARQAEEQGGMWVVFDASWPEDLPKMGLGFYRIPKATPETHRRLAERIAKGNVVEAQSVAELAGKMKVPPDVLANTIARYNEMARNGKDEEYGKQPSRLTAVDTAPYYAGWCPLPNDPLLIFGGLVSNDRLQPVQADGTPIEGLYLAGNTVGGRFKQAYPLLCPGVSHGQAMTLGYLAGEFASGTQTGSK